MQQLIPRERLKNHDASEIKCVSPIFATSIVERHLSSTSSLLGLPELVSECKVRLSSCVPWDKRKGILEKIKRGDWLLISLTAPKASGQECVGGGNDTAGGRCLPSHFFLGKPDTDETEVGPGKWAFFSIDYDGVKNTVVITANRLGSMGDQGRVFGSDGKDFANTTRTLVQQWVPLNGYEEHRIADSARRRYGELRHTHQRFLEGEDKWQVGGKSWHWQPVTPDEAYETKGDAK